jgi:hypothetical protein
MLHIYIITLQALASMMSHGIFFFCFYVFVVLFFFFLMFFFFLILCVLFRVFSGFSIQIVQPRGFAVHMVDILQSQMLRTN